MKKLLSLLSTITITGTILPIVIATSPYEKQLQTNKIVKDSENNLEKLNRNKRKNDNKPIIINSYQDDNKNNLINSNYKKEKIVITTGDKVQSSGVVLNDKVYFGSDDHNVYEYDPATGQQKVAFATSDEVRSSGVVLNNKLYIGSGFDIFEYDPATEKEKVVMGVNDPVSTSGVILDNKFYIRLLAKFIYILN